MGYWSNDGSYVRDDNDIKVSEDMNETQSQYHKRVQAGVAYAEAYDRVQKDKVQAERDFAARQREEEHEYEREQAIKRNEMIDKEQKEQRRQENLMRYGVDFNLRNPESLDDRRSRANLWRCNNLFGLFVDKVTNKGKKFDDLWQQYSVSKSDEERLRIVEEMEKMYPTRESAIRAEERKAGYRR